MNLCICVVFSKHFRRPFGYIGMAGTVETVSSDPVLLIVLIGDAIQIRLLRHGLVECRIEYARLGHVRHQLFTGADADQVRRIMKRRQIVALGDGRDHFLVYQGRGSKFFSAMD